MSLLDQLTSLCIPSLSSNKKYASSIMSLNNQEPMIPYNNSVSQVNQIHIQSQDKCKHSDLQKNYQVLKQPNQQISRSQQKMIRLFDDIQIGDYWQRFIKTENKKHNVKNHDQNKNCMKNKKIEGQSFECSQIISNNQIMDDTNICLENPFQQINFHSHIVSNDKDQKQCQVNKNKKQPAATISKKNQINAKVIQKLTKISYLVNNKIRKINYDVVVRIQRYILFNEKQKIKIKHQSFRKGFFKLFDTLAIINLKYFSFTTPNKQLAQQNQRNQQDLNKLAPAFQIIKKRDQLWLRFSKVNALLSIIIKRNFMLKLVQLNKNKIKIDLLLSILNDLIQKKQKMILASSYHLIKNYQRQNLIEKQNKPNQTSYQAQFTNIQQVHKVLIQKKTFYSKSSNENLLATQLSSSFPCHLSYLNHKLQISLPQYCPSDMSVVRTSDQNIPLKLHHLKHHEEQTNLNDCIDNGHLLMNYVQSNKSFRQQLQNLTISSISKIHSNLNESENLSAVVGYENFILPEFSSIAERKKLDQIEERVFTMRKSIKSSQDNIISNFQGPRKPRSSLIITTKRKQSLNDIQTNNVSLFNSQRVTLFCKQSKSAAGSVSKNSNQISKPNDKQVIKKMLEQLNRKFQCQPQGKSIQIKYSNKKNDSTTKKQIIQKTGSSGKNQRKKCKLDAMAFNIVPFSDKNCQNFVSKQLKEKNINSSQDNYKINLINRSQKISNKPSNKNAKKPPKSNKNSQNCFISLTLPNQQKGISLINATKNPLLFKSEHELQQKIQKSISQISKHQNIQVYPHSQIPHKPLSQPSFPLRQIEHKGEINKYFKIDLTDRKLSEQKRQFGRNFEAKYFKREASNLMTEKSSQNYLCKQNEKSELSIDSQIQSNRHFIQNTNQKSSQQCSLLIRRDSNCYISNNDDSVINQYINYLPSTSNLLNFTPQNQEQLLDNYIHVENGINNNYYKSQIHSVYDASLQNSDAYYTGGERGNYRKISKVPDPYVYQSIRNSIENKKKSFDKTKQDWEILLEKHRMKYLRPNSSEDEHKSLKTLRSKKTSLNESILNQIRQKLQKQTKQIKCSSKNSKKEISPWLGSSSSLFKKPLNIPQQRQILATNSSINKNSKAKLQSKPIFLSHQNESSVAFNQIYGKPYGFTINHK